MKIRQIHTITFIFLILEIEYKLSFEIVYLMYEVAGFMLLFRLRR